MPAKTISVRVTTMDAELEFSILPNTLGKQLFDQVAKTINLKEIWFFGLKFTDNKGIDTWLKLNKKVMNQDVSKKENPLVFKFRAKFFPEDVTEEIIEDNTLRLFYLQVKEAILSDDVYCPPETCVLLASYALQAKYGDYNAEIHKEDSVSKERLLPDRVKNQFKLSPQEWDSRITAWWGEHKGLMREDAMREYLKIAQDLEMYGVNYFEIKNKKNTELWLGVDALGLNVYDKNDRLTPKIGFPWSEIRNISFSDKKFIIKPVDRKSPDFVFFAPRLRINKRILALCMGNHELYMRRRKPDTAEVKQMKAKAVEERMMKQAEREKLNKEIAAREAAESKQREYEDKLLHMQENMKHSQQELMAAQELIARLEAQLREFQLAKSALDVREQELSDMLKRLEVEREMEVHEREKLVADIREREESILKFRREVEDKDEATKKLQEEVEEARRRQQEAAMALAEASTTAMKHNKLHDVFDNEDDHDDENEHGTNGSGSGHCELTSDDMANVHQNEIDRKTQLETNRDIQNRLEKLTAELEQVRDQEQVTEYDILHMENRRAGRDKYKTLKQIRSGNTQRRIDQFENMV